MYMYIYVYSIYARCAIWQSILLKQGLSAVITRVACELRITLVAVVQQTSAVLSICDVITGV